MRYGRLIGMTAIAALCAANMPAKAANLTFDYTGANFTYINEPSVFGNNITASVTFDSTVSKNYTGYVYSSDFSSWSLTSGAVTISKSNGQLYTGEGGDFLHLTNGQVDYWGLIAGSPNKNSPQYGLYLAGGTANLIGVVQEADQASLGDVTNASFLVSNIYSSSIVAGKWSQVSATPLPGTALLFGTALSGILGFRASRRRKAKIELTGRS